MHFKFLYVIFFITTVNAKTHICSDDTKIELNFDEIAFFETPQFPNLTYWFDEDFFCSINFTLYSCINTNKNTRGLLVFTTAIYRLQFPYSHIVDYIPPSIFIFNDSSILVSYQYYDPTTGWYNPYRAFQGYILFDDWGNDCPLESISRINPYNFMDETRVLSFQSKFPNSSRTHPCLWQFSAPKGYGFKFMVQEINLRNEVQLTISNSTNIIHTERSIIKNQAFYNSDNYLKIYLSNSSTSIDTEFDVYLTLIKLDWKSVDDGHCINDTDLWENFNFNNEDEPIFLGYPNNGRCTYNMTVKKYSEVNVKIVVILEPFIDYLEYFDTETNETGRITSLALLSEDTYQTLRFYANENYKVIQWKFVSDGSFNLLGFQMSLEEKSCICSNSTIILNCSYCPFIILGYPVDYPYMDVGYQPFCGNLRCNFTLKMDPQCSKPFIDFDIHYDASADLDQVEDIYKIFSNNKLVLAISGNSVRKHQNSLFLHSSSEIFIEIITMPNNLDYKYQVVFQVVASDENAYFGLNFRDLSDNNHILTNGHPCGNECPWQCIIDEILFTVKTESNKVEDDLMIEMFTDCAAPVLSIYDNTNFSNILTDNDCFNGISLGSCKIKWKNFAVIIPIDVEFNYPFLFFKFSLANTKGCAFKNNIFAINPFVETVITEVANSYETCNIFVILQTNECRSASDFKRIYKIKYLWTSAKTETVKFYDGFNNKNLIFDFE